MRALRAFSPPRLALTTLLLSFITYTSSLTQKHLVCIQPGTQTCVIWVVNWENFIRDIHEIQLKTNVANYCGITRLQDFSRQKFFKIKAQLINDQLTKTMICKQVMRYDYIAEWPEVARALRNTLRFRRQEFTPRGRYRGQTQSQYLAIDRGNGKDEGKAEAHSAADTSRASVSGNSGMGQAQSQSVFDPNCNGCSGRSGHEVENLQRPSGSRPEQSGSVWPNTGQGPGYKDNVRFNQDRTIYSGPVSSGGNGKTDGSYRPIGLPDMNNYNPNTVGRGYTPNGIVPGPTGIGAYSPDVSNGDGRGIGSYNPSKNTGREGFSPSGTKSIVYRPDGTSEVGDSSPAGTPARDNFAPVGTQGTGSYVPSRTIGSGGYSPNEGLGNGVYTSSGPASPGGYLPNRNTGVYVPNGHYNPNVDSGTGSYIPSGTVISGGYTPNGRGYLPGETSGNGRYLPSGTVQGGGYTPSGNLNENNTPSKTLGGGYIPTGAVRSDGYSPIGSTTSYKPSDNIGPGGYNSRNGGYRPSETMGNGNYRPPGTIQDIGFSPSTSVGGNGYSPSGTTGIGGYNPNGFIEKGRPGNTLSPEFIRAPGQGQTGAVNWPIASGPYPGPGGNNYFCCVVPNNGMGLLPTNYAVGSRGPSSSASNPPIDSQYNAHDIPNNLMSPTPNLEMNGSGRPLATSNIPYGVSQNQPGFYGFESDRSKEPTGRPNTDGVREPGYRVTGGHNNGQTGSYGTDPLGVGKHYGTPGQFGKDIPGFGSLLRPGSGSTNGVNSPVGSFQTGSNGGPNAPGAIYGTQNIGETNGPRRQFATGVDHGPISGMVGNLPNAGVGVSNGPNSSPGQYGTLTPSKSNNQNGYYGSPGIPASNFETGYPGGVQKPYDSGINNGGNNPLTQYENGPGSRGPISNYGTDNVGTNVLYRPGATGSNGQGSTYGTGVMGRPAVSGEQYGPGPYGISGPGGGSISQGDYNKDQTGRPYDSGLHEGPKEIYGGMIDDPNSNINPRISGGSNNLPTNGFGTTLDNSADNRGPSDSKTNMTPNGLSYGPQNVPTSNGGQFGNIPYNFNNQRIPGGQNNEYSGIQSNYLDPNSVAVEDDSEAEASVAQAANGTSASASSKGGNDSGRAQTNVHGTYTGSGSFQAQAQITGENKEAQSEVSGGKKGASSSASGSGRNNKSQANVQLGSETGSVQTQSQSNGDMHSSNSQVQGSVKGGMADAQARGPGSTSSQAQIGFTPFKDKDKSLHDTQDIPFVGGGVASAQSSGRTGQSQSQLHGTFKYGITYNGAAQSGASQDKDAVFPNRLYFEKIDVFDKKEKNIDTDATDKTPPLHTEKPQLDTSTLPEPFPSGISMISDSKVMENETATEKDETMKNSESRYSSHTHLDHHKNPSSENQDISNGPTLIGNRRSFNANYDSSTDYEFTTDKDENQPDMYDTDMGFDTDGYNASDVEQSEYANYDEFTSDSPTHESYLSPNSKKLDVKQTLGGNTQQIVLGSLKNHNAEITQKNSDRPDEHKVYQPGESIPGTGGYTIPIGFTGSVKSVASKDKTYVVGSKDSPSQAQTVKLTPGTGKIKYTQPSYAKYVKPKDLRSLQSPKENNRYVSVSKSVTRALDDDNNIRKQYMHTYYTKSSSCGYFSFTCTMVSSAEGRKKVCKPKIPTNPDGTPIRC